MISLCMIVKNEGHCLERCLKSAKDCVDEIIVVDTGSTDDTVKIAKQFGAKIFQYPWHDDFGAARNFSLDQATGDWILYLDADEELEPNRCQRIKALTKVNTAEGYYFLIKNLSDQNDSLKHINVRMFRNKPHYRFKGKLHEQISDGMVVYNSGISIRHYGYLTTEWVAKNKAERNYRINKQMVAADPENSFYLYNLGTACYNLNDILGATNNYGKALQYLDLDANYAPSVLFSYASCLLKLGQIKEGLKYISYCKTHFPEYVDIHFLEGEFYKTLGSVKKSINCFENCLALGENPTGKYTSQTGVGSFLPCFRLAKIYQAQGDLEKAISFQLRGLKANAKDAKQLTVLAQLLKESDKKPAEILDLLSEFSNIEANYLKGLAFINSASYLKAIDTLSLIPQSAEIYPTALQYLIMARWSLTPPLDSKNLIKEMPTLTYINDKLLNIPTTTTPPTSSVIQVIDQLLELNLVVLALKVISLCSYDTIGDQISILLTAPVKDSRLELAAKLVLPELKEGNPNADYYYVLAYYFFINKEFVTAQDMITKALSGNNHITHYHKLLKRIYLKQSLKTVVTALDHYPDNPELVDFLADIYMKGEREQ